MPLWNNFQFLNISNGPGVYRIYITPVGSSTKVLASEFIVEEVDGSNSEEQSTTEVLQNSFPGRGPYWDVAGAATSLPTTTYALWCRYMRDILVRSYRTEFNMSRNNFEEAYQQEDIVDVIGDIRIVQANTTVEFSSNFDDQIFAPLFDGDTFAIIDIESGVGTWTIRYDSTSTPQHTVTLLTDDSETPQSLVVDDTGVFRWSDTTGTKLRTFDMREDTLLFTGDNAAKPLVATASIVDRVVDAGTLLPLKSKGSTKVGDGVVHKWYVRVNESGNTDQLIHNISTYQTPALSSDTVLVYTLQVSDNYGRRVSDSVSVHVRLVSSTGADKLIEGIVVDSNKPLRLKINTLLSEQKYGIFVTPVDENGNEVGPETFVQHFNYDEKVKRTRAKQDRDDLLPLANIAHQTTIDTILEDTIDANDRFLNARNFYLNDDANVTAQFVGTSAADKRSLAKAMFRELDNPSLSVDAGAFDDFFIRTKNVPKSLSFENKVDIISASASDDAAAVTADIAKRSMHIFAENDFEQDIHMSEDINSDVLSVFRSDNKVTLTLTNANGTAILLGNELQEGTSLMWTGDNSVWTYYSDGSRSKDSDSARVNAFTEPRLFDVGSLTIIAVGPAPDITFTNINATDPNVTMDGQGNITIEVEQNDWVDNPTNDVSLANYFVVDGGIAILSFTRTITSTNNGTTTTHSYPLNTPGIYTETLEVQYTDVGVPVSVVSFTLHIRPKLIADPDLDMELSSIIDLDSLLYIPGTVVTWQFVGVAPNNFAIAGSDLTFDSTNISNLTTTVNAVVEGIESVAVTVTVLPPEIVQSSYDFTGTPWFVGTNSLISIPIADVPAFYDTFIPIVSYDTPLMEAITVLPVGGSNIGVNYNGAAPEIPPSLDTRQIELKVSHSTNPEFTTSTQLLVKLYPALPSFATTTYDDNESIVEYHVWTKSIPVQNATGLTYFDPTGLTYSITANNGMTNAFSVNLANNNSELIVTYDQVTTPTSYGVVTITITATEIGFTQQSASTTIILAIQEYIPYTPSTFTFYEDIEITTITPTNTINATSWAITPPMPAGLSMDTSTGEISGTPTELSTSATYTVTNSFGSTTLVFEVLDPDNISTTTFTSDVVEYSCIPEKYALAISPIVAELTVSLDVDWQTSIQVWCSTLDSTSDNDDLAIIDTLRGAQTYDPTDDMNFLTDSERSSTSIDDTTKRGISLARLNKVRRGILYQIGKDSSFFGGTVVVSSLRTSLQSIVDIVRNQIGLGNPIIIDADKVRSDLGYPSHIGGLSVLKNVNDVGFSTHPESQAIYNAIPTTEQTGVNATSRLQNLLCGYAFQCVLARFVNGGNFRRPVNALHTLEFDSKNNSGSGVDGYISTDSILQFPSKIIIADDGVTKLQESMELDPNTEDLERGLAFQLVINFQPI